MPDDEQVYDDGSEVTIVVPQDDPPSSGEWVDHETFFEDLTDDELAAGDFLGQVIDVDDDEDSGAQWGTIENPAFREGDL